MGRTSRLPSRDLRIPHGTSNFKLGTFLCVCLSGFRHLLFQFDTFGCYHFFLAVAYAPYLPFLGSFGDGVQSLPLDSSPSTRLQPAVPAQQVEQLLETPNSPTCTSFESVVRCPYRLWAIMEFVLVASGDFRCLERLQSALSGRRSCASERLLGASHFSFFFYITRAGVFPHLPEAR